MTSEERHAARRARRVQRREEKRRRDLMAFDSFDNLTDTNNLLRAAKLSRAHVHRKGSVQKYTMNLMRNVMDTRRRLLAGEDVREGFIEFDLHERGKARHIRAMHFKERVIQRCLCDEILVPVLERPLVYDNGASQAGKGIHFALFRLRDMLRRYVRKHGTQGWILLVDFSRYFDNIRHGPIRELLINSFTDRRVRRLTWQFVRAFGDHSLGIGSQVSQILAVAYPSRVDHRIKEVHRIGLSARYMDDTYAISPDRAALERLLEDCRALWTALGIRLNPRKVQIIPLRRFSFMKVRFLLTDTGRVIMKPCRKSFARMRRKLRAFRDLMTGADMTPEQVNTSYQSWYGYQNHLNAHRALRRMDRYYHALFGQWPRHGKGGKNHDLQLLCG